MKIFFYTAVYPAAYDQTIWKIQVKKFDFSNFAGL